MTMRRGHHISSVLKALGAGPDDPVENTVEETAVVEPE
jgi:hypothetical protein